MRPLQAAICTNAPVRVLAAVFGPVDVLDNNVFVTRNVYRSVNHLKTLVGTAQSRAERGGYAFEGAVIIPAGATPPIERESYKVDAPLKARLDYGDMSMHTLRGSYRNFYAAELKHPETVIFPPNEFYPNGLREVDIHDYYDTASDLIVQQYAQNNLEGLVLIKTDSKLVVKRHANMEVLGMRIGSSEAFDNLNTGRTVEFHFAIDKNTQIAWVDLDPKAEFPFDEAKVIAVEIAKELEQMPESKRVEIKFSGRDGFHVICHMTSEISTDEVRMEMKKFVGGYIQRKADDRLTADVTKDPKMMRLDYSTLHDQGGLRIAYSLAYPTGLVSLPIKVSDITRFGKADARMENVLAVHGKIIKRAVDEHFPGSLDGDIKQWLDPTAKAISKEDTAAIVSFYDKMGWEAFYKHVSGVMTIWVDEAALWKALQGAAMITSLPLEFKAYSLDEYHHKRDFSKTPEPEGEIDVENADQGVFVVQEHQAKKAGLHYDLRLSDQGVLKSWSVPKLPDVVAGNQVKVLAIQTEDHPMEYVNFEGEIPDPQYGAGVMKIVDTGTYKTTSSTDKTWQFAIAAGPMAGTWSLIRTEGRKWILQKTAS